MRRKTVTSAKNVICDTCALDHADMTFTVAIRLKTVK